MGRPKSPNLFSNWPRRLIELSTWTLLGLIVSLATLSGGCQRDHAAPTFPDRPIEIVVYTKPGGPIDLTVRKFVEVAEKHFPDVTFVPKTVSGAGGIVAMGYVLQKKTDGYTLLGCTKSNIAKVVSSGRKDVDSFDWIGMLLVDPECVIMRNQSPPTTWNDLITQARQEPGKQNWVGPAAGGLDHVVAQKIWKQLGIECVWTPFGSGGLALAALRRGSEGDAYVGNPSEVAAYPNLHVVAVSSPQRLADHPDVPTLAELGLQNLEDEIMWRGFAIKKGCPPEALNFYDKLFRVVTNDPAWQQYWAKFGIDVVYENSATFSKRVNNDRATFTQFQSKSLPTSRWPWIATVSFCVLMLVATALVSAWKHQMVAVPLVVILASVVFAAMTRNFPDGGAIGPATLPRALCLGISMLTFLAVATRSQEQSIAKESSHPILVLRLVAVLIAYVVGTIFLGYLLCTLFFLVYLMWSLGERRLIVIGSVSLGWLLFAYIIFEQILRIRLPTGSLWTQIT